MQKKNINFDEQIDEKPAGSAEGAPGRFSQRPPGRFSLADQFLSTFSLVCRIPLPFPFTFTACRLDLWLPVTALFQSFVFALGLGLFWPLFLDRNIALVAALILLYACFNLFHFDGLLDTADAFLGAFDREKRFAILKDSRIGVYGTFTALMYIALKVMLLSSLLGHVPFIALSLIIFPLAGKTAAALIPAIFPPAKKEGLGALAAGSRIHFVLAGFFLTLCIYIVIALLIGFVGSVPIQAPSLERLFVTMGLPSMVLIISALVSSSFPGRLYTKRLGGYTGDTLGAAVELGELLYLLGLFLLVQWGVIV